MDKLSLIKEFYGTIDHTVIKLETKTKGFGYVDQLVQQGMRLVYGEEYSGITKLKLANLSSKQYDDFLTQHIQQENNICGYFNKVANNICSINLDLFLKEHKAIPQMTAQTIMSILDRLGIAVVCVASGRGYHLWMRFQESIANNKLVLFLCQIKCIAMTVIKCNGYNPYSVSYHLYPQNNEEHNVSLRLFGSSHISKNVFSHVWDIDKGMLNEEESWKYIEDYVKNKTISIETFNKAVKYMSDYING